MLVERIGARIALMLLFALAFPAWVWPQGADIPFDHVILDRTGPKDPWAKIVGDIDGDAFPDILLIDGGKGQLNAAMAAFRDQQIEPPAVISLAKREEEIFRPGESESLKLSRGAFALRLLQYVRDESHRFAQHYHHILRSKSTFDR